jgi:hypothetical protein
MYFCSLSFSVCARACALVVMLLDLCRCPGLSVESEPERGCWWCLVSKAAKQQVAFPPACRLAMLIGHIYISDKLSAFM